MKHFFPQEKVLHAKNRDAMSVLCFKILCVKHNFYTFFIAKMVFTKREARNTQPNTPKINIAAQHTFCNFIDIMRLVVRFA